MIVTNVRGLWLDFWPLCSGLISKGGIGLLCYPAIRPLSRRIWCCACWLQRGVLVYHRLMLVRLGVIIRLLLFSIAA
jgi:hypothetical protein